MANTRAVRSASESAVYRFDTAADNVIDGPIVIQLLIWEATLAGDTITIENGAEVAKFILTAKEDGTQAGVVPMVILPFPLGFRMNGMSIGAISSNGLLTVVLR